MMKQKIQRILDAFDSSATHSLNNLLCLPNKPVTLAPDSAIAGIIDNRPGGVALF